MEEKNGRELSAEAIPERRDNDLSMKIRYAVAELNILWRKINAGGRY